MFAAEARVGRHIRRKPVTCIIGPPSPNKVAPRAVWLVVAPYLTAPDLPLLVACVDLSGDTQDQIDHLQAKVTTLEVEHLTPIATPIFISTPPADASDEELAEYINHLLMCPVCPDETIAESDVVLASQMRDLVRTLIADKEPKEAILQLFVDRYGENVLNTEAP